MGLWTRSASNLMAQTRRIDLGEYLAKFGAVKLSAHIAYRIAVRRKN